MMHFLLTRRSTLASLGFRFGRGDQLTPAHFAPSGRPVEVLSLRDVSRTLWHTSNVTSLMTGQMTDPKLVEAFRKALPVMKKVRETTDWKDYMEKGAFNTTTMSGADFQKWLAAADAQHRTLMTEAGFVAPK